MSYKIGQFKRTDFSEYYSASSIEIKPDNYGTFVSPYNDNLQDGALKIDFSAGVIYIVDFVAETSDAQKNFEYVKVKLKKNNNNDYQSIKTLNMTNKNSVRSIVGFQPYVNYDALVLEASRSTATSLKDLMVKFSEGSATDPKVTIKSLKNILTLSPFTGKKIIKIGIQGPEGMLFVVNGEPIRLGKSGIYISREDMVIQSLGFVLEEDKIITTKDENGNIITIGDGLQFFTMDYIYEEVENNE